MKIIIKNGRVIDPATGTDMVTDLLLKDDRIVAVGPVLNQEADRIIHADGCFVLPGLIDLHVHLREPGFEYKETIESGTAAAAAGGFTTICAMPNTSPVTDSRETVEWIKEKASLVSGINVLPVGAITVGQLGKELADIKGMREAGICAISEDGKSVMDTGMYRKAMEAAVEAGIPVFAHCEDRDLVAGGVMNAGKKAELLGLPGITNQVEDVIVRRDIELARSTGVKLHLCHCSTEGSMELLAQAKENGLTVTAEVCPHHFSLTENDIEDMDTNFKMNPPLRTEKDKQALINGLKNSLADVIATDHAPHSMEEKAQPFLTAPFGIVGLETAVTLTITNLVKPGILTPMQMAETMSYNPARILGIDRGSLRPGEVADITIIDPNEEYIIDADRFVSKGRNTPFNGKKVSGRVKFTIAQGKFVYEDQDGQEVNHDK
ncbi:dihydroorotase [Parasporobacterium paucivorans]|uniref:dihydroorotase n=1 Tax=Parasporobacterium paucivorans TaxID=115544 RepID=UPI00093E2A83|nr:dihydroorotase [Parasporobacterium paucivorans]